MKKERLYYDNKPHSRDTVNIDEEVIVNMRRRRDYMQQEEEKRPRIRFILFLLEFYTAFVAQMRRNDIYKYREKKGVNYEKV